MDDMSRAKQKTLDALMAEKAKLDKQIAQARKEQRAAEDREIIAAALELVEAGKQGTPRSEAAALLRKYAVQMRNSKQ